MEKQQTALDWLESIFLKNGIYLSSIYKIAFEKAKQMEMEQITDAWEDGKNSFSTRNAEIYYNETFKK